MRTTPATARPPPKAVLWKACGSPGALHIARPENGSSEILIEARMKNHVKPAPQLSLSLCGSVQGLGVASGPVSDQAAFCKCHHLVSDEGAIAKNIHGDMKNMTTIFYSSQVAGQGPLFTRGGLHIYFGRRGSKNCRMWVAATVR